MSLSSLFSAAATRLALLFAVLTLTSFTLFAHEPGLSTAMVTVDKGHAEVILTFSKNEVEAMALSLEKGANGKTEDLTARLMTLSGHTPSSARTDETVAGEVTFHLAFSGLLGGVLSIEAPILVSLVPGHRQYLLVRDGRKELLLRCFLTPNESKTSVENHLD